MIGLVGRGIARSRTPAMHMAEATALGFEGVYKLLDVDTFAPEDQDLAAVLQAAETNGYNGLNITYPFKSDVVALLDDLSEEAAAIGAVNTVVFTDGRRIGHNTDCSGFVASFQEGMAGCATETVLLMGAGGAGAAVSHGLIQCGVQRLLLHDVDGCRADELAVHLQRQNQTLDVCTVKDIDPALMATVDGVINATPMGMDKMPGTPLSSPLLRPDLWVADIVYFPLETELLKAARQCGCHTLPGSGMAIFQAVKAFELFTGHPADPARMKATFGSLG